MEIILANPRGFCAGVERAIAIVERAIEKFGAPITILERKPLIKPPTVLPARVAAPVMPDHAREDTPLPAPPVWNPLPIPERPAKIPSEPFHVPSLPATPATPAISTFALPPHLASLYAALDASRAALEHA